MGLKIIVIDFFFYQLNEFKTIVLIFFTVAIAEYLINTKNLVSLRSRVFNLGAAVIALFLGGYFASITFQKLMGLGIVQPNHLNPFLYCLLYFFF